MSEMNDRKDFEDILEEYISSMDRGSVVRGKVVKIGQQSVLVNIGTKTEGVIPIDEFIRDGEITIKEGDEIEARVTNISNALAQIKLSTLELRLERDLQNIKDSIRDDRPVTVRVKGTANRGFLGTTGGGINVYIPKSHIDQKGRIKEDSYYLEKKLQCKVLKIDEESKSILASHRFYLEALEEKKREEFFNKIKVGDIVKGRVKVLKKYGVFVDLGPVDAFLYKDNISWGKVIDPTYYLEVDDIVEVVILNIDKASGKVEVSMKHKTSDPWENVRNKYPEGSNIRGTVVTKKNNGYILEIEEGIDGFIPNEEVSWLKKVDKKIDRRSIVEGRVIGYDNKRRRVLVSLKQIENNPWDTIKKKHPEGSIVKGTVKGVKDFGVFVDFGEDIDGLIRVSDIAWTKRIEKVDEIYKVGDKIEAKILKIEPEKERIHLGVKQLAKDPWSEVDKLYPKGKVVECAVKEVENKYVSVDLPGDLNGIIPVGELDEKKVLPKDKFKPGDEIKALVIDIDHKRRVVILSIRLYLVDVEKKNVNEYLKDYDEDNKMFSLGAILKDKLNK